MAAFDGPGMSCTHHAAGWDETQLHIYCGMSGGTLVGLKLFLPPQVESTPAVSSDSSMITQHAMSLTCYPHFKAGHVLVPWNPNWKLEPATLTKPPRFLWESRSHQKELCNLLHTSVAGAFLPISCSGRTKPDSTHTIIKTPKIHGEFWNWKLLPPSTISRFQVWVSSLRFWLSLGGRLGLRLRCRFIARCMCMCLRLGSLLCTGAGQLSSYRPG